MSDEYDDDPEERLVTLKRDDIKALEKRAKAAEEAQTRAEAAERKLAFAEAGIDLSNTDPKLSYFVKGYEGDLTPEAIKAKAIAEGWVSNPEAEQQAQASEDAAALERMADGAANGTPLPVGADAAYEKALATDDREVFYQEAKAAGLAY